MQRRSRNQNLRRLVPGALLLLTVAAGCAPATSTVSGKVSYRGQPLTSGTVTIYAANQGVYSTLLDAGGTYVISGVGRGPAKITVTSHPAIPLGLQKVQPHPACGFVLPGFDPSGEASKAPGYVQIPEKYGNPDKSGLTLEVAGAQQTFDIKLIP